MDKPRHAKAFVTGASGFIGSNLVDRLLAAGFSVVGYDNFTTGRREFIAEALQHPEFRLVEADVLDAAALAAAMAGCDIVFPPCRQCRRALRFAASAQGPRAEHHRHFNVLEAMRASGVRDIVFSSTGSIYGEAEVFPTPETAPFPVQTSLYGASKLAGEGLIMAYCEGFKFRSWIFRFVSILGERYTHGHVLDFYRQLLADPTQLMVLGDGRQRKSYLYVHDCIDAILHALKQAQDKVNVFKSRHARILPGQRFHRLDHRPSRHEAAVDVLRGLAGMDRRQQLHFSRHGPHRGARLAAEAHDPGRHRAHR